MRDEQMQSCRDEFIREVEVMVLLDHQCVVKLLGVCLGPPLMMVCCETVVISNTNPYSFS